MVLVFCEAGPRCVSALGGMAVLSCGFGVVWKVWWLLIWYGDGLRCTSTVVLVRGPIQCA